jgi:two-component system chemotaxis response regulator CheB
MNRSGPIRVLVVDDSAVIRQMLCRELARDPAIQVIATAPDPYAARDKIVELRPDVVTLDVEMPRMDGITFLRHLMARHPLPVIVLSSLTAAGTRTAVEALEAGAVGVLPKPGCGASVAETAAALIGLIKSAAGARLRPAAPAQACDSGVPLKAGAALAETIFAIGASTGGVRALTEVLTRFPQGCPPTLVVQHMPREFTASFAARLDGLCRVSVREASDGERLEAGTVYVAPGGRHMLLRPATGGGYAVELRDGPQVCHQRPSVDVLFDSVARHAGRATVAALLTGMGEDGAAGLLRLRQAGARTIAQDEATCTVFGMPAAAIARGAAERVVPLHRVADAMLTAAAGMARGTINDTRRGGVAPAQRVAAGAANP